MIRVIVKMMVVMVMVIVMDVMVVMVMLVVEMKEINKYFKLYITSYNILKTQYFISIQINF